MEIPNSEIAELGIAIISLIGIILGALIKTLIQELRHLHTSLDKVEQHLSEAKEELFRVATVVAACKSCPHPDVNSILKYSREKAP